MTRQADTQEIAKWCGWRWVRGEPIDGTVSAWMINGASTGAVTDDGRPWGGGFVEHPGPHDVIRDSTLPDYLNSRDACAEFEAAAYEHECAMQYWLTLFEEVHGCSFDPHDVTPMDLYRVHVAEAEQRVAAILQVIREAKA